MTKPPDDFDAVRLVIEALEPFDAKERERIRWAGFLNLPNILPRL